MTAWFGRSQRKYRLLATTDNDGNNAEMEQLELEHLPAINVDDGPSSKPDLLDSLDTEGAGHHRDSAWAEKETAVTSRKGRGTAVLPDKNAHRDRPVTIILSVVCVMAMICATVMLIYTLSIPEEKGDNSHNSTSTSDWLSTSTAAGMLRNSSS